MPVAAKPDILESTAKPQLFVQQVQMAALVKMVEYQLEQDQLPTAVANVFNIILVPTVNLHRLVQLDQTRNLVLMD